jgi:predicted tellurium resistance membrane protein TerC
VLDWISSPEAWIALATLTVLEIVLGVDNIIFISILAGRLPRDQRARARRLGLGLAMGMRILLLMSLAWLARLTAPLFSVLDHEISGRDLILLGGGLFLLAKSVLEIHTKLEGAEHEREIGHGATMGNVLLQIAALDMVFSLDSVITAIGMARDVEIMVIAVVLAVGFMLWFSGPVSDFVEQHPTVKMLALSFLLLIGMALVADGLHQHIPKGYIYFAMGFSVFVEMLNLRLRRTPATPVHLHSRYEQS